MAALGRMPPKPHADMKIGKKATGKKKTGPLFSGLLSIRPAFNSTSEAVDKAKNALNTAIHEAWIEAEGRDPRNDDAYHDEFCAITGTAP